ncbi:MAG TPA: malto-oligosyltrehalose trehalohydrolase [Gemmatimonadales bacterium]|nr:malto-oligosyltrehalose trehalohydrolase [Gemmatimonadales bacterium]
MSYGRPALGANWLGDRTAFQVWAPEAREVAVVLESPPGVFPMWRRGEGYFTLELEKVRPGALYWYRVDGRGPYPDPASRYQPLGVHGPSEVVDPGAFHWTDTGWRGVPLEDLVLYELHVGCFTPEGTFSAAAERLPLLRNLGITAIELMPVADFPGERNWGYDGAALFAPARCYGTPDDLRLLVDTAHRLGIAVHLDVVYNHFGPDGAYHTCFSPYYVSPRHRSPWGAAPNFDGPQSRPVRDYIVENAVRWVREYHLDGLRLDATHAIVDESPRHIVAELAAAVREAVAGPGRRVLVIAEDVRNLASMVQSEAAGGWGANAVWSDDFHHQMRRLLAGDHQGWFADFTGTTQDLATTASLGWFYRGQPSSWFGGPRGTDPVGIPCERFVFYLQNHDQVGNSGQGDRLHHRIDLSAWRAAVAFHLLLPQTPLLFMGQEWGAGTPFRYFTDHRAELGRAVREGRARELGGGAASGEARAIPDPQAFETFATSRLRWEEREREPHASLLRLTRRLLELRRTEPALRPRGMSGNPFVTAWDDDVLLLRRDAGGARAVLGVVRLRGAGVVDLRGAPAAQLGPGLSWTPILATEDPPFVPAPVPPAVDPTGPVIQFQRPGAVLFRARREAS